MRTNYGKGADFERDVAADLVDNGYWARRIAGSKGEVDVIALKPGETLLVQVKKTESGWVSPAERAKLLILAHRLGLKPIVANKPRRGINYRELTGPGSDDHRPWTPDSYGDAA